LEADARRLPAHRHRGRPPLLLPPAAGSRRTHSREAASAFPSAREFRKRLPSAGRALSPERGMIAVRPRRTLYEEVGRGLPLWGRRGGGRAAATPPSCVRPHHLAVSDHRGRFPCASEEIRQRACRYVQRGRIQLGRVSSQTLDPVCPITRPAAWPRHAATALAESWAWPPSTSATT
jgi:hypothetical protein